MFFFGLGMHVQYKCTLYIVRGVTINMVINRELKIVLSEKIPQYLRQF